MSCRDELQTLLYIDGELPIEEAAAFEAHLTACVGCRRRVDALRAEGALIGEVLREAEPAPAPVPAPGRGGFAWAVLALAAATVGIHDGLEALARLFSQLDWLGPFSTLSGLVFLLTREDIPMLLTPVAALATALVLGATLAFLARHRLAAGIGLVLFLAATAPASATELRKPAPGQGEVLLIPAGETIDDTVIATGRQVVVEGTITGNLVAGGQQVRILGEVRGSLMAFARDVVVDGSVGGDVFSASQNLDLRGRVLRSVHAIAADVDIAKGARVERDALLACESGHVGGGVGHDLHAVGNVFIISGEVARAVDVSSHELDLTTTARIGGEVTAAVESAASFTRAPGAQLAYEPQVRVVGTRGVSHELRQWLTPGFYFWRAVSVAAALAFGLFLYWLVPALFLWPTPPERRLLASAGIGFLALVATPAAAVLLGITVVGLPLGVLAMGTWIVAIYLSGILVALMLGQHLLRGARANGGAFALTLLAGLVVLQIAVHLPYVGGVVRFLVILVGLGLLVTQSVHLARRLREPALGAGARE
jgi:cytoskeletal protein CcmA (bactofilin family)